jgi:mRNA interferase MazF
MAYRRGDVVLVPFPFTNLTTTSVRPAIVVNGEGFEDETGDVILAMVTSRIREGRTDLALSDWRDAGLVRASWVRARLATIDRNLILFSPGKLSENDVKAMDLRLRLALELP